MKAAPQRRLRRSLQHGRSNAEQRDCQEESNTGQHGKLLAAELQQQHRRHAQVEQGNNRRNLEGLKRSQQQDAGKDSADRGANSLTHVR